MATKTKTTDLELSGPDRWIPIVLENIARGCSMSKAAEIANISSYQAYKYRREHKDFADMVAIAERQAADRIRDEIWRRGVEGVVEPVFSAQLGKQIGEITKYDTTLMIFEAKRRDPSYRDNFKVEHTGGIQHTVSLQIEGVRDMLGGAQPIEVDADKRYRAAQALLSEGGDGD